MQKAIFFDRDGVINREIGDYVCRIEDFELLDDAVDCIKLAKDNGFLAILITNQGGIDKGLYSVEDLNSFHQKIIDACREKSVEIDDIYFCPHHPNVGNCICRKPNSGMLEKAIAKFGLNIEQCLMIGDTQRDMDAAEKVGVKGLLIQPNSSKFRLLNESIQELLNK